MALDPRLRFGLKLIEIRKTRGWSQERLALESGLARSYLGVLSVGNATSPYSTSSSWPRRWGWSLQYCWRRRLLDRSLHRNIVALRWSPHDRSRQLSQPSAFKNK